MDSHSERVFFKELVLSLGQLPPVDIWQCLETHSGCHNWRGVPLASAGGGQAYHWTSDNTQDAFFHSPTAKMTSANIHRAKAEKLCPRVGTTWT